MIQATRSTTIGLIVALFACLLGCGSPPAHQPIAISLSPTSASVQTSAAQAFTASVTGTTNTGVNWSVIEGSSGGVITTSGAYTAPSVPGRYHVVVASQADLHATATALVTVTAIPPPPTITSVSVSPGSVTLDAGTTQLFAAQVNGSPSDAVVWTVRAGGPGGTIDSTGLYTAPLRAGLDQVLATSTVDATMGGIGNVTVTTPAPTGLGYSPSSISCTRAVACALAAPALSGGTEVSFSILPTLPAGLAVNTSTGAISGTPTTLSALSTYRVTATNSWGSASTTIRIEVKDSLPSLVYSPSALICLEQTPCALAAPTNSGGAVVSYAIAPALPIGLALDTGTGAISGTPTNPMVTEHYTVTATNSGGAVPVAISVAVTTPPGQAPGHTEVQQCDNFVYLDDGAFKLNGAPFPLKSANFHLSLLAKTVQAGDPIVYDTPRVAQGGALYDLSLQMDVNYDPASNTCVDKDSCEALMAAQVTNLKALGINSVRLMIDHSLFGNGDPASSIPDADQQDMFFRTDPWQWNFMLDMANPSAMDAVLLLEKRAVEFLGARGIRSLLLLTGTPYMYGNVPENKAFTDYLAKLSATMADEPYLIGYDFDNEPTWASGAPAGSSFSITKDQTQSLVQSWVDAVRSTNSHALTTVGNAFAIASVDTWDPQFLPIDFASYHIYPDAPMNWSHDADYVQRETWFVKLNSCGSVCPVGTTFTGGNCHVLDGPPGSTGAAQNGQFQTTDSGGHTAVVGSYEVGYDQPLLETRPFYYVQPHAASCPAGSSSDGANCLVAIGPAGAHGFTYGQNFYYQYLSSSHHCLPPAVDDGANCNVAPIPTGYNPFILNGPVFFIAARHCGVNGRKPAIVGEFGMSTSDLDPNTGAVLKVNDGSAQDQATWLTNVATRAYNCGYQGIQWWEYEDEHWAFPDHFGMWGFWSAVHPGEPAPDPSAIAMRPSGLAMAALNPAALLPGSCPAPWDFTWPHYGSDYAGGTGYSYSGTVSDTSGNPIPYALVMGRLLNDPDFFINTDANGNWSMNTPKLINYITATQFGYESSSRHYPVPLINSSIELSPGNLPAYHPPSSNDQACRVIVY